MKAGYKLVDNKDKKRVLIIGLDGATFNIIKPMVAAGRLPAIGKLMAEGSWGELRSTVLPVTPPAWASFMTGKNPGKHGVYGFYANSEGTYNTRMVSGLSIRAKKIWNYMDNEKIGLVEIPMSYPPEPINGYMISGWPTPSDDSIFTHPPELHTEIVREIGEYMIDKTFSSIPRSNVTNAIKDLYRYTNMRKEAAMYLLRKKGPFNLFVVVFRGTDFVQHEAFKYFDDEYCKANPDSAKKYKDLIFQFYEKMDSIVAELVAVMGNDAVTIIMSDHGGGPMKKKFYINRWFQKEGYLSVKGVFTKKAIELRKKTLNDFLNKIGLSFLNQFVPSYLRHLSLFFPRLYNKHPSMLINWAHTKAFANLTWTDGMVRINLKDRELYGNVSRKNCEQIKDEIIKKLKAFKDPETGEYVVQEVYKKEEIYNGPFMEDAPDLLILTRDTSYYFSPSLENGPMLEYPINPAPAPHRMEGIFISNGTDIKACGNITGLDITDIAPTVLYLMGKQIPDSMDGKVIKEAVNQEYFTRNNPIYYKDKEDGAGSDSVQNFSTEEEEKIAEGLKALGYME